MLSVTALFLTLVASDPMVALERRQILHAALDDVRRSEAYYRKVIASHEKRRPFVWVLRQKRRHERRILRLFGRHELSVPDPQWTEDQIRVPTQRVGACSQAVQHELRNAAIYERAIQRLKGRAHNVFWRLHQRVRYKHLTAFERCVRAKR